MIKTVVATILTTLTLITTLAYFEVPLVKLGFESSTRSTNNPGFSLIALDGTATNTANGGWNIASGCFAINGVCATGGADGGITTLNTLAGLTQTFTAPDDTNVTLTITSSGTNHEFALGWTGELADSRVVDTITASNYLLLSDWYSTSTSDIAEGTNEYYTSAKAITALTGNANTFSQLQTYSSGFIAKASSSAPFLNVTNSTSTNATSTFLYISDTGRLEKYLGVNSTTTHLNIATSIGGAGLTSCTGSANKLTYNAVSKQFACETDQTGGGGGTTTKWMFSTRTASLTSDVACHPSAGSCGTSDRTLGVEVPFAGTIKNIEAYMTTAPASGSSCWFVVRKATQCSGSFSNTDLSCGIVGNGSLVTCSQSTSSINVAANDCLQVFFDEVGTCTGINSWNFEYDY